MVNTFLGTEQESRLNSFRQFVEEKVRPHVDGLDSRKDSAVECLREFGQKGYLGLAVPTEYGGQGASLLDQALFVEAVSEVEPGLALCISSHAAVIELVSRFGTDKQKSRYLPLLARGECIGTLAASEENAGSDLSAVETTVVAGDGGIVLSGTKTWVVSGDFANLACVLAKFDNSLSLWLVDLSETKGVNVGENRAKLGLRSASTNDIKFESVKLAADSFLGSEDPSSFDSDQVAMKQVTSAMDVAKVMVASSALGLTNSAIACSVERARSREQFGTNIGRQQAIQWKLADMSADCAAARMLTYRAAWAHEGDESQFHKYASMCKLYAARTARVHSQEAVQIFGALGVEEGSQTEKLYRDSKLMEICEGTSEMQKNFIAEALDI